MRVGLFVTCLVDLMRPSVGFAALKLLDRPGVEVVVPDRQTCCGQPAYNSGDREDAIALARKFVEEFEGFDHVVAPSGSCSGMVRTHYAELLSGDAAWKSRAERLAARTWELTQFLVDVLKVDFVPGRFDGTVTYHDSCAGLREMGVKGQPRALLGKVAGLSLTEMPSARPAAVSAGRSRSSSARSRRASRTTSAGTSRRAGPTPSCWATWAAC